MKKFIMSTSSLLAGAALLYFSRQSAAKQEAVARTMRRVTNHAQLAEQLDSYDIGDMGDYVSEMVSDAKSIEADLAALTFEPMEDVTEFERQAASALLCGEMITLRGNVDKIGAALTTKIDIMMKSMGDNTKIIYS